MVNALYSVLQDSSDVLLSLGSVAELVDAPDLKSS